MLFILVFYSLLNIPGGYCWKYGTIVFFSSSSFFDVTTKLRLREGVSDRHITLTLFDYVLHKE